MRRRSLMGRLATLAALSAGWRSSQAATRTVQAASRGRDPGPLAVLNAPPPLQRGSKLIAVAPGTWWENPGPEAERLRRRCAAEGWTLEIPPETSGRWRWFSAPDATRRHLLERAWSDPTVAAVLCVAGGWGSARLLENGWRSAERPLWLVGFSDVSALLLAQVAAGHGGAVHGSTAGDDAQWQRLAGLLRGEPLQELRGTSWRAGVARGPLVVTNLTVATSLIGTPWFPNLRGAVLLLEDVGEAPYRVDRMLTQWRCSGLLQEVAGIGVGRFRWQEDDVLPGDLSLDEVLRDRLTDLGVPVLAGLPVGHGHPNLALPLGRRARLDADRGVLAVD